MLRPIFYGALFTALGYATLVGEALVGEADVTAVEVQRTAPGVYRFDVTVRHADTGWDHYADQWQVLTPEGQVLGTRTLYHPHVDEQPFTRSLDGVAVPPEVKEVVVRARDSVHGEQGQALTVTIEP